ncbi:Similar to oaf: Out at first protein (Drosophila virilis) [Cotesia congregata]|uniref:Similar to oaf: Out at first protein (Drosophila virilis) n=1 Tax=Cotesia congregata TaxID=51543 RepID=A0A8J2MP62_COTCN|nr:Similar to oaf: Out at first protein (Drosophila virilis) [Cotesia congregata]
MKELVKVFGIFLVLFYSCGLCTTLLSINVKNQGGDVFPETIVSNVTEDTITLEFQRSDGTLVTQLIDFRNRGQNQLQVLCFVNHFSKTDFISSDAMSKLRQKNPGTVRVAEEDRGYTNYTMDLFIDISKSLVISKHISTFCSEAADKNDGKKVVSPYRCGIKTCKRYYIFTYQAKQKQNCLWDD